MNSTYMQYYPRNRLLEGCVQWRSQEAESLGSFIPTKGSGFWVFVVMWAVFNDTQKKLKKKKKKISGSQEMKNWRKWQNTNSSTRKGQEQYVHWHIYTTSPIKSLIAGRNNQPHMPTKKIDAKVFWVIYTNKEFLLSWRILHRLNQHFQLQK